VLTAQQEQLIMMLPETEYGRALFAWIQQEIDSLETNEEYGGKICNDPLIEDFRTQMGIKIGLKRVLRKPNELIQSKGLKQ
jgi:hypothetical protein